MSSVFFFGKLRTLDKILPKKYVHSAFSAFMLKNRNGIKSKEIIIWGQMGVMR